MASISHQIDTNHEELIHDSQTNYYGTRLATCSSDCKVKIFDLGPGQSKLAAELHGHDGPVWQLDWSHPQYGELLASCSYDRRVIIWKEVNPGNWEKFKEHKDHDSSVNSIQWAPREFGLMLACASADGSISILRHIQDDDWESTRISNAHGVGVNAISWAPPISSVSTIYKNHANQTNENNGNQPGGNSLVSSVQKTINNSNSKPNLTKRFVSGGCDNLVKIWKFVEETYRWIEERQLDGHSDWVRDVAWAPSIGLPKWYIASCSQDKKVIIWTNNDGPNGHEWESKVLNEFNDIVWHVSWSVMGNMLAVSWGENKVSLWKEDMNGDFRSLTEVNT